MGLGHPTTLLRPADVLCMFIRLLLCQQTLRMKTAGCDQTPTAYPLDETQEPRGRFNSQQPLAVHVQAGWVGKQQGGPKIPGYKELAVWSHG
jgi:hypothetical protein